MVGDRRRRKRAGVPGAIEARRAVTQSPAQIGKGAT